MANLLIYDDSASITTVLSTELNSLSINSAVSSAFAPGGELYCDMELLVQYSGMAPTATTVVAEVYFLQSVDGTNYPVGSAGVLPAEACKVARFSSRWPSTTSAERLVICDIKLPRRTTLVLLHNTSGTNFAATGNTLKIKPWKFNLNG